MIARFERPVLGTVIRLDEQSYELAAIEPYVRKSDGAHTQLLVWESTCPVAGCGRPFVHKTGFTVRTLQRRCGEHLTITKPVKGRRGRKVRTTIINP